MGEIDFTTAEETSENRVESVYLDGSRCVGAILYREISRDGATRRFQLHILSRGERLYNREIDPLIEFVESLGLVGNA